MTVKITKPIIDQKVLSPEGVAEQSDETPERERVHEAMERPEFLLGSTYKIKPPIAEHALYITINDVILNEGTDAEERRPYEVFINSKDVTHFQWVVALTRVLSAVFRKGGDIAFIVDEMRSVYDPQGGYFKKGGVFMNSLVSEIGYTIERHMKAIGFIQEEQMSEEARAILAEKRRQAEASESSEQQHNDDAGYPSSATVCPKCHVKAVIMMDGCKTCLECGSSKCG